MATNSTFSRKFSWTPGPWTGGFDQRVLYLIIAGIATLVLLLTTFYQVEPDEQAVILRFGKYSSTEDPGLHIKVPFGIDEAIKVKTRLILQEEFGFRTADARGQRTQYSPEGFDEESLMLTGDLNVADVEWIVQFQIGDAEKFLFRVRDPMTTVRDIAHAIMRRVVGDRLVTDVLTIGRAEIALETTRLMQETFDKYDIGVRIVAVKLQDVNPPETVKPSFNDVNSAKQEQEQSINQAEKNFNKIVPEARGDAEKVISEAQGYAAALLNHAKGDSEKMESVLREFSKAPDITRRRMYIDAMQEVLTKVQRLVVIDESLKGVLPVFSAPGVGPSGAGVVPVPANDVKTK